MSETITEQASTSKEEEKTSIPPTHKFDFNNPNDVQRVYDALNIFKDFLSAVRGEPNLLERIRLISDPQTLDTMTRLNPAQIDVDEICDGLAKAFPDFQPLEDLCRTMMRANKSLDGQGIQDVIQFEGVENMLAMMRQGNVVVQQQPKEQSKDGEKK